ENTGVSRPPACDYVELRCRSAFSFLEASANPEDLASAAAERGHAAIALADRDGLYGIPRFHAAARGCGVRPIVGAEIHVACDEPDTGPAALALLVETPRGYRNLARLITCGHERGAKGEALVTWAEVEEHAADLCALARGDERLTPALLDRARAHFPGRLWVDVSRHGRREQERANRRAADRAAAARVPVVATGDVRHARTEGRMLTDALVCLREKTRLDRAGRLLAGTAEQHLHSPQEVARRLARDRRAVRVHAREPRLSLPRVSDPARRDPGVVPAHPDRVRRAPALWTARARARAPPARARAGNDREARSRGLLPDRARHRALRVRGADARPRAWLRRQQRGVLCARQHPGGRGRDEPAVRALPLRGARRVARHRPRPAVGGPAREGDPVRVREVRTPRRRDDRRGGHLPHAHCGARDGQGARPRR